ncbi:MAG: hypothetical protein ACXVQQ_07695 [Gaiellaceae bacterium]
MIAYTADAWTQIIVAISIFVPVVVTIVVAVVFLRGAGSDPDAQRMRRAQREYKARRER